MAEGVSRECVSVVLRRPRSIANPPQRGGPLMGQACVLGKSPIWSSCHGCLYALCWDDVIKIRMPQLSRINWQLRNFCALWSVRLCNLFLVTELARYKHNKNSFRFKIKKSVHSVCHFMWCLCCDVYIPSLWCKNAFTIYSGTTFIKATSAIVNTLYNLSCVSLNYP